MTVSDSDDDFVEFVKQEKNDTREGSEDNDDCYNMSFSLSKSENKMQRALKYSILGIRIR